MSYSDREIIATTDRDQTDATIKDMAADVALMYRRLRAGKVPMDAAKSIASLFAAQVVFPGCECDAGG